jgi:hypothetical protein
MASLAPFRVVPRIRNKDSAEGLCLRCGLKGSHLTCSECIDALRDTIAELEIRIRRMLKPSAPNIFEMRRGRVRSRR